MSEHEPPPTLAERLREVPLSWWLPVPALVVYVSVLSLSERVWTTLVETHRRSGRSGHGVDAHRYLILAAFTLGGYVVIGLLEGGQWWGASRRMPRVTDADETVTRVMLRGLFLLVFYVGAFFLLKNYAR